MVLPQVRSDIELESNTIARGLADRDLYMFSAKFVYFIDNINIMDVLFGSLFLQLQDVGKPFTRCGSTRHYLQFIAGPLPQLYNKSTETNCPLPIGGEIKQWTGRNCSVEGCNLSFVSIRLEHLQEHFPCVQIVYGQQPGEEEAAAVKVGDEEDAAKERSIRLMAGKYMFHPMIEEMTISPDPESNGVLILDPHLGPKWRLVSTREVMTALMSRVCIFRATVIQWLDVLIFCYLPVFQRIVMLHFSLQLFTYPKA